MTPAQQGGAAGSTARSVRFVGDIFVQEDNPAAALAGAFRVLRPADVLIGNLEIPICDTGSPLPKSNGYLRSEPRMVEALTAAGFDAVSVANNHSMNYGYEGLRQTLQILDVVGIGHAGGGADLAQAHRPFMGDCRGWRYALLSYTSVYARGMFEATAESGGLATVQVDTAYEARPRHFEVPAMPPIVRTFVRGEDADAVKADIEAVRDQVDAVIVAWHWGVSIVSHDVVDYQREMGRMAIDAGADAVIGHHPHTLQPIDFHRGKPICYCIGNFHHALGAADFPAESTVVELTFEEGGAVPVVRVHPLWLELGSHPVALEADDPRCAQVLALLGQDDTASIRPALDGGSFEVAPLDASDAWSR